MDDWRDRMLGAISDTRLLLICLSPAYLESDYCTWEFTEYLKHEAARALLGEGVAPVYFIEIPGWTDKDYDQRAAERVADLRRRQHIDLRPWFKEGAAALKDTAVQARMDELNHQIHDRLGRIRKVLEAKGNVDRHNEHFKGRTAELRRLARVGRPGQGRRAHRGPWPGRDGQDGAGGRVRLCFRARVHGGAMAGAV